MSIVKLNTEYIQFPRFLNCNYFFTVPYQSNSWDCGVFICRYAYSMLLLRGKMFTVKDSKNLFNSVISSSAEFNFDMDDICRIRREITKLIMRLSCEYRSYKDRIMKTDSKIFSIVNSV